MAVVAVYILCVVATFLFGVVARDEHGVSFVPAIVLSLPWVYVLPFIAERTGGFSALTAYYDLPFFAICALMNVGVAETVRRSRARVAEAISVTPR